ncbi:MAG: magnesium transporter [Planctomycetaceae bacterium]|nr:magnesium transporter [Planctomycetaceae bacterium]
MKPLEAMLQSFIELHPEEAARSFEELDSSEAQRLFQTLPAGVVVSLLSRLSPHIGTPLLAGLENPRIAELLAEMPPRAASTILRQFDPIQREALLEKLPRESAKPLRELTHYAEETAGGMMDPRVASLSIDLRAEQAIAAIRRTPRQVLHYLYVTDRTGQLVGVLTMRDLLVANPETPIAELVRKNVISVPDTMGSQEVINLMRDHHYLALPVVDYEGRLVGIVTESEALEAGQRAAFEDLQKLSGASADERALSPVSQVVKSRLPWLMINLGTAFLAAAVVGLFEETITKVAALAVLMPVVAGQGGNTGAQSLAVVIRGLALREIISGLERKVIRKELFAGVINGVLVAIATAVAVFGWQFLGEGSGGTRASGLALVIFLAMIINMGAAALAGAVIPIVLRSMGRDPAQSSSIFLTTVTDIVGFASFLGFAVLFLPMLVES